MPGPGLYPLLKPGTLHDSLDDIALIYANKMRGDALGEVRWMAEVMQTDEHNATLRLVMARALRMAAMQMEAATRQASPAPQD